MATSPNYGWSEPDNTSLVKDGALAMRTLGNAIDTSLWNVGYGQAGKNKIINGAFDFWARGTSFSVTSAVYTADRFKCSADTTTTFSQQSFTAGTAPVSGYEGTYFLRAATGAGTAYVDFSQPIEDVRTFAGQTATFSFWAKANLSTTVTSFFRQSFGSGGSANVDTAGASASLTTSWQRFTVTVAIPSISGKTVGTGSALIPVLYCNSGAASKSIDTWGWQLEAGQTATPFSRNASSIQGELAACQRYYVRYGGTAAYEKVAGIGTAYATTGLYFVNQFPVTMRVAPTSIEYSTMQVSDIVNTALPVTSLTLSNAGKLGTGLLAGVASGAVQYRPYDLTTANSTNGYVGFSAEL